MELILPLNWPALHVNDGRNFLYFIPVFSQGIGHPVLGSKACHFCNTSHDVSLPFSLCSSSRTNPKLAMLLGFNTYTISPTRGALLAAQKGETFASISREEGFTSCSGVMMVKYKPWPAMEKTVADIIKVHPMEIWPSRYKADGSPVGTGIRKKRSA